MEKKKRKLFAILSVLICLTLGTVCLTGCGSSKDSAGKVTEWSFYSPYGPEDSACCEIWTNLFEQIKEETDGQLVIKTYWSGQNPYEGSDMLKVVDEGIAQMSHFYGGYVTSVDPAFGIDTLPLLFPADSMKAWDINKQLWGNFKQDKNGLLEKKLEEDWNATMVHMVPATAQRLMTMGYEVNATDGLKGHKVRVYSSEFGKFVEALGGTPVAIESSEVYTALSTNLIDAVTTGVQFATSNGYFDYCDTINLWEISQSSDGLMVNLDALNALPDDVRATFLKIMGESANKPEMKEVEENAALVKQHEEKGVKVITPSDEVRDKIAAQLSKSVWTPWAESAGELGQQLLDLVSSQN